MCSHSPTSRVASRASLIRPTAADSWMRSTLLRDLPLRRDHTHHPSSPTSPPSLLTSSPTQGQGHLGFRRHLLHLAPHPSRQIRGTDPPRDSRVCPVRRSPGHLEQAGGRAHCRQPAGGPRRRLGAREQERPCRFGGRRADEEDRSRGSTDDPRSTGTRRQLRVSFLNAGRSWLVRPSPLTQKISIKNLSRGGGGDL